MNEQTCQCGTTSPEPQYSQSYQQSGSNGRTTTQLPPRSQSPSVPRDGCHYCKGPHMQVNCQERQRDAQQGLIAINEKGYTVLPNGESVPGWNLEPGSSTRERVMEYHRTRPGGFSMRGPPATDNTAARPATTPAAAASPAPASLPKAPSHFLRAAGPDLDERAPISESEDDLELVPAFAHFRVGGQPADIQSHRRQGQWYRSSEAAQAAAVVRRSQVQTVAASAERGLGGVYAGVAQSDPVGLSVPALLANADTG